MHWSCFLNNTNLLWKTAFCAYSFCVTEPALPCLNSIWERHLGFPWEKIALTAGLRVAVVWEKAGSSATADSFIIPSTSTGEFASEEPCPAAVSPGCVCEAVPAATEARGNSLPWCQAALCFAAGWDCWIPALGDKSRLLDLRDLSQICEEVRNWCPAPRHLVEATEGDSLGEPFG